MNSGSLFQYVEARVDVPTGLADAVCNFVTENIAVGLVLEEEEGCDTIGIVFFVPEKESGEYRDLLSGYLSELVCEEMPAVPEICERTVPDADWIELYKSSFKPIRVGPDILVRPLWHPPQQRIKYDIVIEPKMAFGTGSHETTRSCLKVIRQNFQAGMCFLDLGTGSGILSILADKMGARRIKAIDYDLAAVENCRENFKSNQVSTPHEVLFGSIEKCEQDGPYEFVCSNIIKSTILPMLPRLLSLTAKGGFLVLSGLLEEDEARITDVLAEQGQTDFGIHRDNGWLTYVISKG